MLFTMVPQMRLLLWESDEPMNRYKMIVMTAPVEGRESEYNDWYQNTHLDQVVAIDGFKSAQRFQLTTSLGSNESPPYLAIYEIETDDIDTVVEKMKTLAGTQNLIVSDALGSSFAAVWKELAAPVVRR
jgi:hypothetical protein